MKRQGFKKPFTSSIYVQKYIMYNESMFNKMQE